MSSHSLSNKYRKNILILIIFFICVFTRLYNFNGNDLWYDELLSYWVADPNIDWSATISRNLEFNHGSQIAFTIILKFFFKIFGYDPDLSRLVSILFGILTFPLLLILNKKIKNNNSTILLLFLFTLNSYLISYDHELRSYSFVVFIFTLNLIFFINLYKKNRLFDYVFFSFVNLIGLVNHSFFAIIIFSEFIFLFLSYNNKNIIIRFLIFQIIVTIFFYLISIKSLLSQIQIDQFWIQKVNVKFLIDFYFSRFFSSKLLGTIYLITFFSVVYFNFKEFFKKNSLFNLLLIIIFFSYLIPLLYQFIKIPILTDRYIIFIVIPILLIISHGVYKLNNSKLKKLFIIILCFFTFGDAILKIQKKEITKPEFKESLKYISKSNTNDVLIEGNIVQYNLLKNYFRSINKQMVFLNEADGDDKKLFWHLCYLSINLKSKCHKPAVKNQILKIDSKNFHLVSINLYKIQ